MNQQYNEPPEGVEAYVRGKWDYDQALTAEEEAEYDDLVARWDTGDLSDADADFDRLTDLDDRFWLFGLQRDFDDWIAAGRTEEEWRFEFSLTHEEFVEFAELGAQFDSGELAVADEHRLFELEARLYSFGVVTDYPNLMPR